MNIEEDDDNFLDLNGIRDAWIYYYEETNAPFHLDSIQKKDHNRYQKEQQVKSFLLHIFIKENFEMKIEETDRNVNAKYYIIPMTKEQQEAIQFDLYNHEI